jgi:P4 family phage/plasmid primase-like protien
MMVNLKEEWEKHKQSKKDYQEPFKELVNMFVEDFNKFGKTDEQGNLFINSGFQEQKVGKIKKLIENYYNKRDLSNKIIKLQPLYYDKNKIWWIWNQENFKWEITDETDILNLVGSLSWANTIKSKEKTEILESLKQSARNNKPKEIKNSWIQFKDTIVDIETGKEFRASSEYMITNPIPYSLNKERFIEIPTINKIFEEWVGKDYVQTLYEIISYCLIPDYPLHRIFCFIGGGMNGKSCFLNLLRKFIGLDNCCSTELDTLLNSRFEVTRLHKKLVCLMGETNFSEISKTSLLKKLSGGDLIGFEYKNKNPFEEVNYAKIIIATNNLPTTDDKTIGFYRRWLIIDFPNQFSEQKDILSEIPEEEYECLAVKCLGILKDLLDNKEFHNEGDIELRTKRYEEKSDPLQKFLREFTEEDINSSIWKFEFEKKLNEWCKENKFRQISEVAIGKKMKEKGIEQHQKMSEWFIDGQKKLLRAWSGIKWKCNSQD